ncbi:MAG: thioredoxin [Candidatus Gracilibacteria bacterium]
MAEFTFTDANFDAEAMKSSIPVLVDCFAVWCGPCKMMAPTITEVAEEYGDKVRVGKIDVDENPEVAQKFGIQSIPTLLFIKNGEVVDRTVGVQSKDKILDKLDELLK